MEDRKRNGTKIGDFTDYIMKLLEKLDTPEFKKNNVTEFTLMCQALIFFFAGQDQVTNLSAFLVYFVSKNPEIERKIVVELHKVLAKNNGVIDHECLSELTYLTACIDEVLRLYPVFFRAERVCTKDWEMDGVRIKKGMTVMIPIWAANRNPRYWENPEEFDPERFMPYNRDKLHPYGLTSFGHGPKACTGIRFAYETLLLTAAHLYKELQFTLKDGDKIEIGGSNLFFCTVKPIHFHCRIRN
jgi:cytochrome P450 family 3 subfamily A